ncbi:hypothetical protein BDV59DRAFT_131175 [Aspergillus ambiguus]|uniref:uncharacterized protein n=1 Tax=Aspergillus ambiguus TaxID=176160 RepID=UPI003CCCE860
MAMPDLPIWLLMGPELSAGTCHSGTYSSPCSLISTHKIAPCLPGSLQVSASPLAISNPITSSNPLPHSHHWIGRDGDPKNDMMCEVELPGA